MTLLNYTQKSSKSLTQPAILNLLLVLVLLAPWGLAGCDQSLLPTVLSTNIGGNKSWDGFQAEIDQAKDGDTIDLSGYVCPIPEGKLYTITVPEGLSIRLLGNPELDFRGVCFAFEGDNTVIIENLVLTLWLDEVRPYKPPPSVLHFQSGTNHLQLVGSNDVILISRDDIPGYGATIGVPVGSSLTIDGDGSLDAYNGCSGAGIGGGYQAASGSITIAGGSILAFGGESGHWPETPLEGSAAIGGGSGADGGTTIITGGKVTARGMCGGAGIGGGYGGSGGSITISGGFVESYTHTEWSETGWLGGAASIGGGYGGQGGTIRIEGGEIEAYSTVGLYRSISGSEYNSVCGPAVGNGYGGRGGTLAISGGKLSALSSSHPGHASIGCTIMSLPEGYSWQAGALESLSGEEGVFPDEAFISSKTYSYVIIEAK
jgi:hypothetical protein